MCVETFNHKTMHSSSAGAFSDQGSADAQPQPMSENDRLSRSNSLSTNQSTRVVKVDGTAQNQSNFDSSFQTLCCVVFKRDETPRGCVFGTITRGFDAKLTTCNLWLQHRSVPALLRGAVREQGSLVPSAPLIRFVSFKSGVQLK